MFTSFRRFNAATVRRSLKIFETRTHCSTLGRHKRGGDESLSEFQLSNGGLEIGDLLGWVG